MPSTLSLYLSASPPRYSHTITNPSTTEHDQTCLTSLIKRGLGYQQTKKVTKLFLDEPYRQFTLYFLSTQPVLGALHVL